MTPSELKYKIEQTGRESHFFARSSMKFFGDTMRNYGVRSDVIECYKEDDMSQTEIVEVWELYRKRPVKHGRTGSSFFRKDNFHRAHKVS